VVLTVGYGGMGNAGNTAGKLMIDKDMVMNFVE
jgi:hypothetical protein